MRTELFWLSWLTGGDNFFDKCRNFAQFLVSDCRCRALARMLEIDFYVSFLS